MCNNTTFYKQTNVLPLQILSLPALQPHSPLQYTCKFEGSDDQYDAKVDFSDLENFAMLECNMPPQSKLPNISILHKGLNVNYVIINRKNVPKI